jgi:adenine/guanine phosphoribosyltransferase-like PRPP-binding protein
MKKKVAVKRKKPTEKYSVVSDYLHRVYDTTDYIKLIDKMVLRVSLFCKKYKIEAIAFTGHSGAAVAYPLSYKLKIPIVCIRKGSSHYGSGRYEGIEDVERYIIVDDFIETGATIRRIKKQVKTYSPNAKLIGIFLYGGSGARAYKTDGVWKINVR